MNRCGATHSKMLMMFATSSLSTTCHVFPHIIIAITIIIIISSPATAIRIRNQLNGNSLSGVSMIHEYQPSFRSSSSSSFPFPSSRCSHWIIIPLLLPVPLYSPRFSSHMSTFFFLQNPRVMNKGLVWREKKRSKACWGSVIHRQQETVKKWETWMNR